MCEPQEMKHTCVLDVADAGGATLDEVGEIMCLTRERIRQIEVQALRKARAALYKSGAAEDVLDTLHYMSDVYHVSSVASAGDMMLTVVQVSYSSAGDDDVP